jgi:FkbM family methyltransferase
VPRNLLRRLRRVVLGPPELPRRFQSAFRSLGPDSIAIDCGANVGTYTALMVDRGATVYAFEPNPNAFDVLAARFAGLESVHCSNAAVSDREGRASLYLHRDAGEDPVRWSTASSLLASKGNVSVEKAIDVQLVDLDAFIRGLGRRVTLLKLDVEGVEVAILRKLLETGTIDLLDAVLVEMHEARIPALREDAADLRADLARHGATNVRLDWV